MGPSSSRAGASRHNESGTMIPGAMDCLEVDRHAVPVFNCALAMRIGQQFPPSFVLRLAACLEDKRCSSLTQAKDLNS